MSSTLTTSCRACLKETLNDFYEINKQCYYSQDDHLNFCDILNFCSQIKIETNDGLPQRICTFCAQELQRTYEFLRKVITSDKKLHSLIESNCHEDSETVKDPLENVTDTEDEDHLSGAMIQDDYFMPVPLDNVDNTFEDSLDIPFMSPHPTDSDKDDSDFLLSVESQIFPQGRLKCKLCQKAYFTNVGLQAHMDIHLPKSKAISKDISKSAADRKRCLKLKKNPKVNNDSENDGDDNSNDEDDLQPSQKNRKEKLAKPKKMFPCQVCGKQMISASKLRYHMVMHTGEKDYLCTMCPKAYSTIYALKHHMRAHTGERPYECKFCGDRFLRPTTLKSHMRRHTGERPYGCDICGKRFIQHSSMATHMKLNHMDKTISCPYCDKKYARQTDLNTHLLSHSGDKPFACQMCPSRFTRQSNLNKHMNQQHSGDNAVERKIRKKSIKQNQNIDQDLPINIQVNDMSTTLEDIFEKPSCSLSQKIMSELH